MKIPEGLDDDQRARLMVVAGKCPVHRMLVGGSDVTLGSAAGTS